MEVMWQDGAARRVAVAEVTDLSDDRDAERIRWYLEDYAEFPADPAPLIAREAENLLAQTGAKLFAHVFSSADAAGIWERVRDRLFEVRVEVDTDPGAGPGLAWRASFATQIGVRWWRWVPKHSSAPICAQPDTRTFLNLRVTGCGCCW